MCKLRQIPSACSTPLRTQQAGGAKPAGWFHPSPSARNLQASSPGSNQANPRLAQNFSSLGCTAGGGWATAAPLSSPSSGWHPLRHWDREQTTSRTNICCFWGVETCLLPGLLRGSEENTLSPTRSGCQTGERMRSRISRPARSTWALPASPFL